MGSAQADPLHGKLAFWIQQGLEGGGKGSDASGGLGTHDPLRGDFNKSYIHHGFGGIFRQQLIQHSRVGGLSRGGQLFVFLLSGF